MVRLEDYYGGIAELKKLNRTYICGAMSFSIVMLLILILLPPAFAGSDFGLFIWRVFYFIPYTVGYIVFRCYRKKFLREMTTKINLFLVEENKKYNMRGITWTLHYWRCDYSFKYIHINFNSMIIGQPLLVDECDSCWDEQLTCVKLRLLGFNGFMMMILFPKFIRWWLFEI